MLDFEV